MDARDLSQTLSMISRLMEERLGCRGPDLARQLRRAGRSLPRRLRAEAAYLLAAEAQAGHPKLARLIDANRVAQSAGLIVAHLRGIDPAARRSTARLRLAAVLAFYLLATSAAVIGVLSWRGFV